jgi:hypothetical protein
MIAETIFMCYILSQIDDAVLEQDVDFLREMHAKIRSTTENSDQYEHLLWHWDAWDTIAELTRRVAVAMEFT